MRGIAVQLRFTRVNSVIIMGKYTAQIVITNGGSGWISPAYGQPQWKGGGGELPPDCSATLAAPGGDTTPAGNDVSNNYFIF
jgi:hypothetical protein